MFFIISIITIIIGILILFIVCLCKYSCKCLEPKQQKERIIIKHTEDNEYIYNLDIEQNFFESDHPDDQNI
jgi:hypothetical protein